MYRKTDIYELDYPKDDVECWERYPKYNWVYDLSRLLDAQGYKWCPYENETMHDRILNMSLHNLHPIYHEPGYIYLKKPDGKDMITEVHILKGEIKSLRHFNTGTNNELDSIIGELELRINAFVTLHFQKFTGVISIETQSNILFRIRLKPYVNPINETNSNIEKLLKRIYKKTDVIVNGPADQALHELLTS